jgi:hypothetical protein
MEVSTITSELMILIVKALTNTYPELNLDATLISSTSAYLFLVLGELGNDPAERTVPSVDPANLNQVILAEGNTKCKRTQII